MNRMRLKISQRLKESQNTTAMLTTFNEVDMSSVMQLRKESQVFDNFLNGFLTALRNKTDPLNRIIGSTLAFGSRRLSLPFNWSSVERLPKLAIHANHSNVALFVYNPICIICIFVF